MSSAPRRIPHFPDKPFPFVIYLLRHIGKKPQRLWSIALVAQIVATVADLLVAWALGRIVAAITAGGDHFEWNVTQEILLLALLWFIRSSLYRVREFQERRYMPDVLAETRNILFNRLKNQSQSFLHSNFTGVLANNVRRAAEVVNALHDQFQSNIVPLVTRIIGSAIILWNITPLLTLFLLAFVGMGLAVSFWRAPRFTTLSRQHAESASALSGFLVDTTSNLVAVQQNVGWAQEQMRFSKVQDRFAGTLRQRSVFGSYFWGSFDAVMMFFLCGFMALLAYGWSEGNVSNAQLTMAAALVLQLFASLAAVVQLMSAIFDDIGVMEEALQKIATPLVVLDTVDAKALNITEKSINFQDVHFAYPGSDELFAGLNLHIPEGQNVGLVGISGSGKTTLCQLLLRAYDVNKGKICISSQNISEVTQDSLRQAIAVIPQEPALFHRTLADNIRYGRPEATDKEVVQAAIAAQAHDFIEKLPEKYETYVGERGVKLSGGQRQRIAIARAILKDAPILIFDEATSALDSETEHEIQKAMNIAMRGRTTLVIAHRLATLAHLDRILVLHKGAIIEDGSFQELIQKNGAFAKLWTMQAGGFLPENYNQSQTWHLE